MNTNDELLDHVDENDVVIGALLRSEAYDKNIDSIHRMSGVLLVDHVNKKVLLQQRSDKKRYPLMWVVSAGGHYQAGEDILDGAYRELDEELGIETPIVMVGKEFKLHKDANSYVYWFIGIYDGQDMKLSKDEIERVKFFSKESLDKMKGSDFSQVVDYKVYGNKVSGWAYELAQRYFAGEFDEALVYLQKS
ncbi:NUDIX domain-containing protein [Candidatus Dojkabacteria bacterium]|uniref:NUDIX domain-containing protein n=1 Tax=Candidatus Dojkabacteria bacterium TaxID=2099670 RepID=A0A955L7S6_9BACT|nr:NUDIX domain-containing protein [Candidatus Dojkabacteria bacterium]